MTERETEAYSEFLITLQIWGKWSRGGIPRYKCPIAPDTAEILPIDPDYAQEIDSILAKIKFIFGSYKTASFDLYYIGGLPVAVIARQLGSYKTASFDLYYIGGLPVAVIARQLDKPRYKITAEIQEIESLLFFSISKK